MSREYRVVRSDTGELMTNGGYTGQRPDTQHGTFLSKPSAELYKEDLESNTNSHWLKIHEYQIQSREVTDWTDETVDHPTQA